MSYMCVSKSTGNDDMPVAPAGVLKQNGWLPGTFCVFSNESPRNQCVLATIDICPYTKQATGFIKLGSQYLNNTLDFTYANDNEPSGLWTKDQSIDLMPRNSNEELYFDKELQVSRTGTASINYILNDTGIYKLYVFEKYTKAYRDSDGVSGGLIDWNQRNGYPELYVSKRGLLTTEKEHPDNKPVTYVIGDNGIDELGHYVLIVSA